MQSNGKRVNLNFENKYLYKGSSSPLINLIIFLYLQQQNDTYYIYGWLHKLTPHESESHNLQQPFEMRMAIPCSLLSKESVKCLSWKTSIFNQTSYKSLSFIAGTDSADKPAASEHRLGQYWPDSHISLCQS